MLKVDFFTCYVLSYSSSEYNNIYTCLSPAGEDRTKHTENVSLNVQNSDIAVITCTSR